MSVLYKALQKAEKDHEQRQTTASGKGFDPQRLAGSGAIKLAGGGKLNWRLVGFGTVGLLAVLVGGLYVVTQTQPGPRVAAPAPAPPQKKLQTGSETPAAQTSKPAQGTIAGVETPALNSSPRTAAQTAQAAPSAPSGEVASAQTKPAESAAEQPRAVTAVPKSPAPQPKDIAKVDSEPPPQAAALAKAEPGPPPNAASPVAEPSLAEAKPAPSVPKQAVAQKPVEISADSPAQMLSPPISVARADALLSGVGNAVQVRQIAKDAQDNVGAGYNALLRGEYDTALGFYNRAIEKEPTSVLALLGRGAALQKLHRLDEARESYDKALKIDPENREALTNVTSIVAERAPAEALNTLLDLEKQYPGFSPIKAQIGLLYAKTGNMEQALDYLRRAVALTPDATMYQYNLALVLDHMNLREQAIAAYEHVLDAISNGRSPPELSSNDIERRVRYLQAR
jgi:tetratricopeptide (TPR) repeat protein